MDLQKNFEDPLDRSHYKQLLLTIKKEKLKYLGHIMQNKNKYCLLQKHHAGQSKKGRDDRVGNFPGWRISANGMAFALPHLSCSDSDLL